MSAPTDHPHDQSSVSFYAPKSARAELLGEVSDAAAKLAAMTGPDEQHRAPLVPAPDLFDDPAIVRLRARRSLDPDTPPPPPELRGRSWLATVSRLGLVALAAAAIALVAVGQFPSLDVWSPPASDRTNALASASIRQAAQTAPRQPQPMTPRLTAQDARGNQGEPAPLGVALQGRVDGALVMITGLAPGMTLSAGGAVGDTAWQVPATDLRNAWVVPPKDFVGTIDLMAELRFADNTIAHRQPIHFEWVATEAPPPVAEPAASTPPLRQLDRDEIAILLKRGKDLFAAGDLAAARLVLQPAAEAGDAEAALALATTYDPSVLRELRVYGFAADIAQARAWYEKARAFGSAEAPDRLERLAGAVH